jgi:Tfp pilus assembly protein PilV
VKVSANSRTVTRPGITLIEVLLGLAIFLLALVPLGALVDLGTDNAMDTMLQSDGTRLAQSKMAEVEAGAVDVKTGGSGTYDDEPNWSWIVASTPGEAPNLYTVTVTASHELRGKTTTVVLSQMIVDPAMMGTAAPVQRPETATTGSTTP